MVKNMYLLVDLVQVV